MGPTLNVLAYQKTGVSRGSFVDTSHAHMSFDTPDAPATHAVVVESRCSVAAQLRVKASSVRVRRYRWLASSF
jgi:hypothetical protein